jgi:hypothetical protein
MSGKTELKLVRETSSTWISSFFPTALDYAQLQLPSSVNRSRLEGAYYVYWDTSILTVKLTL